MRRSRPPALLAKCEEALKGQVSPEFLRSQIEVGTRVCNSMQEARDELVKLRSTVAKIAAEFGLAPIAASTHPFAQWQSQQHTDKERYNILAEDLQQVARRLVISGMHVHVGIEDDDLGSTCSARPPISCRISSRFPPHRRSGRATAPASNPTASRCSTNCRAPASRINSAATANMQRTVELLVSAGLIEDATKIWWDLRLSARFPTLEMRITDVCPLHRRRHLHRRFIPLHPAHALSPAAREPALAPLPALPRAREPLAGATLWHRAGPGGFRQGRACSLPDADRGAVRSCRRGRRPISAASPR